VKSIALAVGGVAAVVVGCFLLWSVGVALLVSGTDGKLKLKIGESDFPKKLFTETEVPKKLSVLSYLGIK
jgi:hypothetical protein